MVKDLYENYLLASYSLTKMFKCEKVRVYLLLFYIVLSLKWWWLAQSCRKNKHVSKIEGKNSSYYTQIPWSIMRKY